jgi:SAM-dependent methyltransferase
MRQNEYDVMASLEDDHWWYRGLRTLTVDHLSRGRGMGAAWRIVDVGCGTGGCYRAIQRRFLADTYVGIDLEPKALGYCRQRGVRALIRAAAHSIPIRPESADVIMCLDVLCYASTCPEAAIHQFYEALRPGGVLILNLPAFDILRGEHDIAVGIYRRFRRVEARSLLERAGFTLVTSTYWNITLFLPMLIWRWLSRSNGAREATSDVARSPSWLNPALSALLWVEVRVTRWISLPLGSSVFLVAQKPR